MGICRKRLCLIINRKERYKNHLSFLKILLCEYQEIYLDFSLFLYSFPYFIQSIKGRQGVYLSLSYLCYLYYHQLSSQDWITTERTNIHLSNKKCCIFLIGQLWLHLTMAIILGADNSFSLFQNTALVISLLFLALVVIKLSLYLLNFKRHYYIYIITLLFISQLYNASGNVFFYNLSFILLLGIMGECFLYSEYRHKRSIS